MNAIELARMAARASSRLRADLGVGPAEGVCPFDLAEQLGIPVRLVAMPSVEGMYSSVPRLTILVSIERPPGRRRYTCGHELGHHVFGHQTSLDELIDEAPRSWDPKEFVAQRFAAGLLMPKLAIDSAFAKRRWSVAQPTPEMVFAVAQELGVGFTTLVWELERTLRYLPHHAAEALRDTRLPQIRQRIAGFKTEHDVVVVDQHWSRPVIDLEVGDVVVLPESAQFQGTCASLVEGRIRHIVGGAAGIGSLSITSQRPKVSVRVSRREFTGLARYRHLAEVVDE